jgi:hypothetical protein
MRMKPLATIRRMLLGLVGSLLALSLMQAALRSADRHPGETQSASAER